MPNDQPAVHPTLGEERVLAILAPAMLDQLPLLKQQLGKVFPRTDIVAPRSLEHLAELVARSAASHKLVLAVGGDGTLHQVLQHIDPGSQVLGILPAGTGNDFARTIDFPARLPARIAHLARLKAQPLDYGIANDARFINSAGFGIDSETLKTRRRARGPLAGNYIAAYLKTLLRLRAVEARIDLGGEVIEGRFMWVLAMNSPYIGGGTRIAPRAAVDDGLLDLLLVGESTKLQLLRYLPAAMRGTHLELPVTTYRQVRSAGISLCSPLDELALDGELSLCASATVKIEAQSGRLQFLR